MYRLRALENSLRIIKNYDKRITKGSDLKSLVGIGKGTIKRIDEIIQTGTLKELRPVYNTIELQSVHGIGYKTARNLVKKYNIQTIDELKKAHQKGLIELSDTILKGLKYHGIYERNIPRSEMTEIDKILNNKLLEIGPEMYGIMCGSYRRLSMTSNDIDFLFTSNKPNKSINYMELFIKKISKYIVDSLTSEDVITKYMGYFRLSKSHPIRRIDIRYVNRKSLPSAMLYFTGGAELNKNMRMIAIELGYLLNEYGLYKTDKNGRIISRVKVKTEEDIFRELNMEYLQPHER
jgi:DNA polymerase/3'-5' exonuclease PolX